MEWGDPWGSTWGGALAAIEDHSEQALDFLPDRHLSASKYRAWLSAMADRWQIVENLLRQCYPYLLLDIDRVHGTWLDLIGVYLRMPRQGRDDDHYRRLLSALALVLYPGRRAVPALLAAVSRLTPGAITYSEPPPKTYVLAVTGGDPTAVSSLQIVLELCRPATYQTTLVTGSAGAFGFGSSLSGPSAVYGPFASSISGGSPFPSVAP